MCIISCFPLILAACYAPWKSLQWEGPLIEGNQHAGVVQRCELFTIYPTCESAFIDYHGKTIDRTNYVQKVIDGYLPQVSPLIPWISATNAHRHDQPRSGKLPYTLHILTISPIVVLAVPRSDNDSDRCAGHIYREAVISSARLPLVCYSYSKNPKIAPGSFWFSPELATGAQFLADNQLVHTIKLSNSRLELIAQGDVWNVQRNIVVPCERQEGCVQMQPVQIRSVPSADGTEVTDAKTQLIWRRCVEGMSWNGSTCIGNASRFTFEDAQARAKTESDKNHKNWRVPNINELSGLGLQLFDIIAFPNNTGNFFWSSSSKLFSHDDAWAYDFYNAGEPIIVTNKNKSPLFLRLVREK